MSKKFVINTLLPIIQTVIHDSLNDGFFGSKQLEARIFAAIGSFIANKDMQENTETATKSAVNVAKDVGPIIVIAQTDTSNMKNPEKRKEKRLNLINKMIGESVYKNSPSKDFRKNELVSQAVQNLMTLKTAIDEKEQKHVGGKLSGGASITSNESWIDENPFGENTDLQGGWEFWDKTKNWFKNTFGIGDTKENTDPNVYEDGSITSSWSSFGKTLGLTALNAIGGLGTGYLISQFPQTVVPTVLTMLPYIRKVANWEASKIAPHVSYDTRQKFSSLFSEENQQVMEDAARALGTIGLGIYNDYLANKHASEVYDTKKKLMEDEYAKQNEHTESVHAQQLNETLHENKRKQETFVTENQNRDNVIRKNTKEMLDMTVLQQAQVYLAAVEGVYPEGTISDSLLDIIDSFANTNVLGVGDKVSLPLVGVKTAASLVSTFIPRTNYEQKIFDVVQKMRNSEKYTDKIRDVVETLNPDINKIQKTLVDDFKQQVQLRNDILKYKDAIKAENYKKGDELLAGIEKQRSKIDEQYYRTLESFNKDAAMMLVPNWEAIPNSETGWLYKLKRRIDLMEEEAQIQEKGEEKYRKLKPALIEDGQFYTDMRDNITDEQRHMEAYENFMKTHPKPENWENVAPSGQRNYSNEWKAILPARHLRLADLPEPAVAPVYKEQPLKPPLKNPENIPLEIGLPPIAQRTNLSNALMQAAQIVNKPTPKQEEKTTSRDIASLIHAQMIENKNRRDAKLARILNTNVRTGNSQTLRTVAVPAYHRNKYIRVTPVHSSVTGLSFKRPATTFPIEPPFKKRRYRKSP